MKKLSLSLKVLLIIFISRTTLAISQNNIFSIDSIFDSYQIVTINSDSLLLAINNNSSNYLNIQISRWELNLVISDIISSKYQLVEKAEQRTIKIQKGTSLYPMNGYTSSGGRVSITINHKFIYGFIKDHSSTYFIAPLCDYIKYAADNSYIIYKSKSENINTDFSCGSLDIVDKIAKNKISSNRMVGNCFIFEYAIASDYLMFQHYGSVTSVENHNIAIINNVLYQITMTNLKIEFILALSNNL